MQTYTLTLKDWFIATRPWSFTVTALPTLFTLIYVFLERPDMAYRWPLGLVAILGAVIFQAGGNLLDDYYDFKDGIDVVGNIAGNDSITSGRFSEQQIHGFGWTMTGVGIAIGLFLTALSSWPLLIIGILGTIGSVYYTRFKAHALGDALIFIVYGPIIMQGTYFAMTQHFSGALLFISVHFAFITVDVLHANNLRDIEGDTGAGIKTFASILGVRKSIFYYNFLQYGSYAIILISVVLKQLPVWSLLVLATLPVAWRNTKIVDQANEKDMTPIKPLIQMTAQLQLVVSLALIVGLVIALVF